MKIIYSPEYNIDLGGHVFPTVKYDGVYQRLTAEKDNRLAFIEPVLPDDELLALAHTADYIHKLKTASLSPQELCTLELPYSSELVNASWLCADGTIKACRNALAEGCAVHLGGGFHHAFAGHGEGFCVLNDIAIGIRVMQQEEKIEKALVIDCDLHQGNGTAAIFKDDRSVYTFSIHQENNYPIPKQKSTMDIGLADGTGDEEYLLYLRTHLPKIIEEFQPQLMVYVAGADPYEKDQLGGLRLTMAGLEQRDQIVFSNAKKYKVPVAAVLAGGYAVNVEDTITIHYNLVKKALEIFG